MGVKEEILLIILCTFALASCVVSVRMTFAVHSGVIRVPQDYPTIQEAVNAASPGATILVSAGTYNEHVCVNKSLNIIGEGAASTTVWCVTDVFETHADEVTISGFKINTGGPVSCAALFSSHGCNISDNVMIGGHSTIFLMGSNGNIITRNEVFPGKWLNGAGIHLLGSDNNIIRANKVGKDASSGILIHSCTDNKVEHNKVEDNWCGILISDSKDNVINSNTAENNKIGIALWEGRRNRVYHNNLINNPCDVVDADENFWDNGAEGNYWSDYNGTDLNGDGIGDTYVPWQDVDYYPLMAPWILLKTFYVDVNGTTHTVTILSDSTIASFDFNPTPLRQISFNSTGPPGGVGFCNVTIPKALLDGDLWVLVDMVITDFTLTENETHNFVYFTYSYSTRKIRIIQYTPIPGDINYDGRVDLYDIVIVATAYGSRPGDPEWNPAADVAPPWEIINLYDAVTIVYHYGETYQD